MHNENPTSGSFPSVTTKNVSHFAPAFFFALLFCTINLQAQSISLPFQPANDSLLDPYFTNSAPSTVNVRQLIFTVPNNYVPDTNNITYGPDGYGDDAGYFSYYGFNWTGGTSVSSGNVTGGATGSFSASPWVGSLGDNLTQAVSNGPNAIVDGTLQYTIKGGPFDGKTITLKTKRVISTTTSSYDPGDGSQQQNTLGTLTIGVDWGFDPLGNPNQVLLNFYCSASAYTDDASVISLGSVCSSILGYSDTATYVNQVLNAIPSTVSLQGAIPEFLFLYDFSGSNAVKATDLIPSWVLIPDAGGSFSNAYQFINQYNAGYSDTLPTAFSVPAPDSSGYTPGGNACGPTSLMMDLASMGIYDDDFTIYDNTMMFGLQYVPDNFTNNFLYARAQAWLEGDSEYQHQAFSASSPMPAGSTAYLLFDTNSSRIPTDWDEIIDPILSLKKPIIFRTDLGLGSGIGGGHVILLLGTGHSDYIATLYGTGYSGDYYVVADPAGNYYGNPGGFHYGLIEQLTQQSIGMNYGGTCALYPKELLRQRTKVKGTSNQRLSALIVNAPIPCVRIQAKSPVTLTVTDSLGRHTGIDTTGTVSEEIPQSWYQPAVGDDEVGDEVYPADGTKGVVINNPLENDYQIELVGTGSGSYTLTIETIGADGVLISATNFVGTTSLGQHNVYFSNGGTAVAPAIQVQPTNQTVNPGDSAFFSVTASGSAPLYYRWFNGSAPLIDNASIFGAHSANLVVSNVSAAANGAYRVVVSNSVGSVTSSVAMLVVLGADTTPPTIQISSPASGSTVTNTAVMITGHATDNVAVGTVYCEVNEQGWNLASTGNNWATWSFNTDLNLGTNTIRAFAVDVNGNSSSTNLVYVNCAPYLPVDVQITGPGTVTPNYAGQLLQFGRSYKIAAKAAKGCAFRGWSGSIVNNSSRLTFIMTTNFSLAASFADITPPLLVVTSPAAKKIVTNDTVTASGRTKDNVGVTAVFFKLNTSDWALGYGTTNWLTPPLPLIAGTNILRAYASDAAGNTSRTNTITFLH